MISSAKPAGAPAAGTPTGASPTPGKQRRRSLNEPAPTSRGDSNGAAGTQGDTDAAISTLYWHLLDAACTLATDPAPRVARLGQQALAVAGMQLLPLQPAQPAPLPGTSCSRHHLHCNLSRESWLHAAYPLKPPCPASALAAAHAHSPWHALTAAGASSAAR